MAKSTIIVGVLVDEETSVSFVDICENCDISEDELLDMLEHGLIPSIDIPTRELEFNRDMLDRIKSAYRLQADLGLNSAGVVLALELIDELNELNQQLEIVQKLLDT
jgi:chaperone modulatory protein CbpM